MPIVNILSEYQASITRLNTLITNVHNPAVHTVSLGTDEIVVITESAFLRMFIAWEGFLEKSFVHYLTGNTSISGKQITCYANPKDDIHANQILIGMNKYFDWSTPETVRRLSKLFLENGEPYETTLASITSDIYDLKTIRNSVAHISSTTNKNLDSLGTRKLQRPCSNITVYDLILATDPLNPTKTVLQSYQDTLAAAAHQICQ